MNTRVQIFRLLKVPNDINCRFDGRLVTHPAKSTLPSSRSGSLYPIAAGRASAVFLPATSFQLNTPRAATTSLVWTRIFAGGPNFLPPRVRKHTLFVHRQFLSQVAIALLSELRTLRRPPIHPQETTPRDPSSSAYQLAPSSQNAATGHVLSLLPYLQKRPSGDRPPGISRQKIGWEYPSPSPRPRAPAIVSEARAHTVIISPQLIITSPTTIIISPQLIIISPQLTIIIPLGTLRSRSAHRGKSRPSASFASLRE